MDVNNNKWILFSTTIRAVLFFAALATTKEIFGLRITFIAIMLLFTWSLIEYILRRKKTSSEKIS